MCLDTIGDSVVIFYPTSKVTMSYKNCLFAGGFWNGEQDRGFIDCNSGKFSGFV